MNLTITNTEAQVETLEEIILSLEAIRRGLQERLLNQDSGHVYLACMCNDLRQAINMSQRVGDKLKQEIK